MSKEQTQIAISCFGSTDAGVRRTGNEDAFLIADLSEAEQELRSHRQSALAGKTEILLAVSDGMGGAAAGELASGLAVNAVREALRELPENPGCAGRLKRAVEIANERVWQAARQQPQHPGMGATLTAALAQDGHVCIAQIGNSRAYLIRDHKVTQLTRDQSLVQNLIEAGVLTVEQAPNFPQRHAILQALGHTPAIKVAMTRFALSPGDYLLLCSDGLSDTLNEAEIRFSIENSETLEDACWLLIELANARGGEDNITVVLARVEGTLIDGEDEYIRELNRDRLAA